MVAVRRAVPDDAASLHALAAATFAVGDEPQEDFARERVFEGRLRSAPTP